ncbi:hypothetical protein ACFC1T_08885 [Kitasatospora sp. NPDC056076]|uniref:hypothetical protein n=1 Tax=Kitasatospora sp. NPDC056076 TaxID=3345703 RepID=UPI0035DB7EC9
MVKVQTGCQNCTSCRNSLTAEALRKTGRALAAVYTLGATKLLRRTCRACGHPTSIHR